MAAGGRARRAAFSLAFLLGFSSLFLFYKNMFVLRYPEQAPQVTALAVFCASFAGLSLAALAREKRAGAGAAVGPEASRAAVCLASAAATAGLAASEASWPSAVASAAIGAACLALFLSAATCAWARTASRVPLMPALALVAGSCALSFVWSLARSAAWFPPGAACLFPLASAAGWLACERLLRAQVAPEGQGAPAGASPPAPGAAAPGLPREMPALLVALYLVSSLIRSAAVSGAGAGAALAPNSALTLASTALDLAMLGALLKLGPRRLFYLGWLVAAGVVFLGSAALGSGVPGLLAAGSDAVALGRLFIMSLLFVYAASTGRTSNAAQPGRPMPGSASPQAAAQEGPALAGSATSPGGSAPDTAAGLVGLSPARPFLAYASLPYAASVALRDLLLAAQPDLAEGLSAIVVGGCAVVALLTVALTVRALLRQSARIEQLVAQASPPSSAAAPAPDRTEAAVERLARDRGLTEKERQACLLLARGYSMQAAADAMGVSLNTVRTHCRGVYSKLGVHTRQELIELVELASAQARAPLA